MLTVRSHTDPSLPGQTVTRIDSDETTTHYALIVGLYGTGHALYIIDARQNAWVTAVCYRMRDQAAYEAQRLVSMPLSAINHV